MVGQWAAGQAQPIAWMLPEMEKKLLGRSSWAMPASATAVTWARLPQHQQQQEVQDSCSSSVGLQGSEVLVTAEEGHRALMLYLASVGRQASV